MQPRDVPKFYKDSHKAGYMEVAIELQNDGGLYNRNWMESGKFFMNVANKNGDVTRDSNGRSAMTQGGLLP